MPEEELTVTANIEVKKKPAVKVSSGIGDSDGFPVFEDDVDGDAYCAPKDPKWGFRITGGAEFRMPITVFQVSEGSRADRAGIRLGDIILEINGVKTRKLTLAKAHEIIDMAGNDLNLVAKSMDYDDEEQQQRAEARIIEMKIPVIKPPSPPREFVPTPLLGTRVWHPIMWQEPEAKPDKPKEETGQEKTQTHQRIIGNIRRFFKETQNNPELRQKIIEDMLIALPR